MSMAVSTRWNTEASQLLQARIAGAASLHLPLLHGNRTRGSIAWPVAHRDGSERSDMARAGERGRDASLTRSNLTRANT